MLVQVGRNLRGMICSPYFLGWTLLMAVIAILPTPSHAERVTRYPVVDLHVDLPYQVGFKHREIGRAHV